MIATRRIGLALSLSTLALGGGYLAGCGGGGGGGGGATAAAATSGTTGGSSSGSGGTTAGTTATVESLRVAGGALVTGDLPIAIALAHPSATPTDVDVSWSKDAGATWSVATPGSGSVGKVALATGPAPGVEHVFVWATAADIPGFEADVRVRVSIPGGSSSLASAAFAVDNQPVSTHVAVSRWPYLQMPVAGEAAVAWRTQGNADSVIEWGPTAALGRTAGDPQASTEEHWVTLQGLQPGTRYYYRVVSGGRPITPRYSFSSAPANNVSAMKFVVVGDSGMGNPEQYAIAARMQAERADFFLHTGDIVYPAGGFPAAIAEYNRRYFDPYKAMGSELFAMPVVGNHDMYGLLGQPYKQTFAVPTNNMGLLDELFFSFEWGDAKFIAIETNMVFQVGFGPHLNWLVNELRSNTRKWLIVYMHTPLYSCGQHGDDTSLQDDLEPLFENNKVDLVLCGHDHDYERTIPIKQFNQDPAYPGLVHIITGGGGAALRPINPNARTAVAQSVHHYLRVQIQGDWLTSEAVDINGAVIDSVRIRDQ